MSKENSNLRLLGSPVNLTYRSKKREDKKNNIRNRPRSALQTSCIALDSQERLRRPFSADAKEHGPTTRTLLKAFSAELLQSYNKCPTGIRIAAPTLDLLGDTNSSENQGLLKDKELCSNASDYGSEDTFISLGTKIKARAQLSPKPKTTNSKNYLRYRNIAKKGHKQIEASISEDGLKHPYGMEVKITERPQSPIKNKNMFHERSPSPPKTRPYESYFIPLEGSKKDYEDLSKISFAPNLQTEVEQAIDNYSKRLILSKQQLSLVEEESSQDVDSVPSQNLSSLSPENSLEEGKDSYRIEDNNTGRNTYTIDEVQNKYCLPKNTLSDPKTYTSFYDDFRTDTIKKMSSTIVHTDSSSKDSGYQENTVLDEKFYKQNYSLPTTSSLEKSNSPQLIEQPKSLDSVSTNNNEKNYAPDGKGQWKEPMNHSRLLYKDFFLKKEGHVALPPQNSPCKDNVTILGTNENAGDEVVIENDDLNYPSYLMNSTTKAYTSKVIEDYKKELEAINNLHELTLKDINIDAISPTPLNIDKLFENHTNVTDGSKNYNDISMFDNTSEYDKNKNALDIKKRDVSKMSTKELISNYFKVKENDFKTPILKNMKKKTNNMSTKGEVNVEYKQDLNNKNSNNSNKGMSVIKNEAQKNFLTAPAPLSARIEGVQNDKDIDSWMSLNTVTPRVYEIKQLENAQEIITSADQVNEEGQSHRNSPLEKESDPQNIKELSSKSTVLDIYSMLKEIESYGENPVTSVTKVEELNAENKAEERSATPKDNFLEIFEFLEKVEQSANDALSMVTNTTPQTTPKLEALLKLPQTELAQRLVTASLQLEERSCCIALLQESLAHHKEQMISKVSNLEKQSLRNVSKVKQECEETIKRHQNFIDQLINDKKTLNHRIEQLVDERRNAEERWKRAAHAAEQRHQLELRNQHDKMAAAQQVARQRWVRQKAEKIKELTVKGLEGELREMAERQQKEISDLKMFHAEQTGRHQARHAQELEELRRTMEEEKETALVKERQLASSRLEKQILELEVTYQEQRTRLVAEMRAENERVAAELAVKEKTQRGELEKWRHEQEDALEAKKQQIERDFALEKEKLEAQLKEKQKDLEKQFEQYKMEFEAEQQSILKKKVTDIAAQHKQERDREIDRAIDSMEAEAQAGRKELQDAIRRNKEQYEAELKELAETEQATLRRYQEAQARVRQTEDKCAEMEVMISQLETRNRLLTEKNNQLESRAEEIRNNCEELWSEKIENYKREIEDMKKTHEEQMHQLYAKVKVAVARKDSAIQALTRDAHKHQEKIALLEQKLQQQRKDFLKQK